VIKKVKGAISLPSGELFLGGDIEIDEQPEPLDEEFLAEQTRVFNEIIKRFQIPTQIVVSLDGSYIPTGPVVESTLAEKVREKQ